eukprot:TRINITY_DN82420_c0_g1_i1.p1 TRINITY_DN82420_c0_g1~~TRINITY_DN82420_c0_g1_i1.p1  ORF type:complete len:507 (-),score=200.85 TRINITY_DN82420_c0_g1_i1:94-1614(-)
MAEEAKGGESDQEEAEDAEKRAEKLNPELLQACMKNDTENAVRLIEMQADPCCEDSRQWSPLVWAASHGNETLTRLLIKHSAADVFKYDESQGKVKKKKHSPLHWAAFKGHHKVLWLLLAPPIKLSHHEKDAIGNTALHQAAAGGSLECAKCLMAQGCDVLAKNDRGHTPYALCTVPEVQRLLQKAMETMACKATGKQFSSTVLRYLCSWSLDVYCESAVSQMMVYEHPDSTEKEKPVTWCTEVWNTIVEHEQQLSHALHLNALEAITAALDAVEDKPVDCKLVHKCRQVKAKLEAEIALGHAMQVQAITSLDDFGMVHDTLTQAVEDAEEKGADIARVDAAKTLRRKLMSEASLIRATQGPQKTTVGHIMMLEELTKAAQAEAASEDLVTTAQKLIAKLESERQIQHRVLAARPLNGFEAFKDLQNADAKVQEGLPAWWKETADFDAFHQDYKNVVEVGEIANISPELHSEALAQLAHLEHLLVLKKQDEAEQELKALKKKKGKK